MKQSNMTKIEESLHQAHESIVDYFAKSSKQVFNEKDLYTVFAEEREKWLIPHWAGPVRFVEFLTATSILKVAEIASEEYSSKRRYIGEKASAYDVAMSLAKGGYFSHGTAVFLHGLNDQISKTLYVNREQSVKPSRTQELTQERVNLAFSHGQRSSKYVFKHETHRIVLLSGKNTNRLGVIAVKGPSGEHLETTDIARTLVDIVVRSGYAGGVRLVQSAYEGALGRVSGREILITLQKLNYIYPYHQSIGFLLQRAGYSDADIEPFEKLQMNLDFYLIHGMREREYDVRWRLFYPKGL